MPNPNQIQQGDVTLERVDVLPADCRLVKRSQHGLILAESDITNNRHFVPDLGAKLFEAPDKTRYVVNETDGEVSLLHSADHNKLAIGPGVWRVGRVHEIDHLTGMVAEVVD